MPWSHVRPFATRLLVLAAIATPAHAHDGHASEAPASATLAVRGAVPRPQVFTREALQALGADTVSWRYRDADHRAIGVRLDKVIAACGWERGPMDRSTPARHKRAGLRRAIIATAPDGFASVFSAGELDPVVGSTRAYVVWSMDGAPLAAEFGALRLAVVTDTEPSRSIHDVRTLNVVDLSAER